MWDGSSLFKNAPTGQRELPGGRPTAIGSEAYVANSEMYVAKSLPHHPRSYVINSISRVYISIYVRNGLST